MVVEINLRNFPQFESGLDFAMQMMEEESVFCLPGEVGFSNLQLFSLNSILHVVAGFPDTWIYEDCSYSSEGNIARSLRKNCRVL